MMFIVIYKVYVYNKNGDNMKRKKRKLKTGNCIKLIIMIILVVIIIFGIKNIIYKNSDEYKLKEIGYNDKQINEILKLDEKYKEKILSIDYDDFLITLFNEKYFIFDNFDRYLNYHLNNKEMSSEDVVAVVNVSADYEYYTNTKETDTSKGLLMLLNKYNYLPEDYEPENLMDVKNWYAYGENQIIEEVYDKFIEMFNDAKEEGLTLIITSGFRDYDLQSELYEDYEETYGEEEANTFAAKPGFSEHQTGLALDIVTYDVVMEEFEETKEFKWMQENAHKYGFILRYPKDKELITGYSYEPWHYRYVGTKVANQIKELGITFDEYYAYYVK